ncbi:hypothetical protein AB0L05_27765 [Nonomuraea pusilla]|uniref:hypothetical protein n=1 Tax=Nonomuraea pusilla TaxID=46177 RepID=UPI00332B5E5B
MGTINQVLLPEEAAFQSTSFAQYVVNPGGSFPVTGLAYDASNFEGAFWKFAAFGYGSGPLTVDVIWYADTSTTASQGVTWVSGVAAITPGVDTTNVESKGVGTQASVSTTLGSTNPQKLMKSTITLTSVDSMAAGDECWLQLFRSPSDAGDTLTGDAIVTSVRISYSDT